MKTSKDYFDNKEKEEERLQKEAQKKHARKVDNLNLPKEDYLRNYNEVNKLIKHNIQSKTATNRKHAFLVAWQELELD